MALLDIRDLCIDYVTRQETVKAVNGISLSLEKGETLGLVGETGAGKTTTALSILGLLPERVARCLSGEILFDGKDILKMSRAEVREVQGESISMIFQDPMTALNPTMPVGTQIAETLRTHGKLGKNAARQRAEEMLKLVGIPAARAVEYPHQFSGGMKQRVIIAIALACSPKSLIADEPTTALDVTIQAQVLDMINELKKEFNTSLLLITHDLGIVAQMCDKVAIIYAGEIMETGTLEHIFEHPLHPYTIGLFNSIPSLDKDERRLKPIKGLMPDPAALPDGCVFHPRCPYSSDKCKHSAASFSEREPGHFVRCHKTISDMEAGL